MSRLGFSFLGSFHVELDQQPITRFYSAKARGLVAYLAVESAHPQTRDVLMGLFWPDQPQRRARQNLRQTLSQLAKSLRNAETQVLLITRQSVQFNPQSDHGLDVAEFLQHLDRGALVPAVSLYQGLFLRGFHLVGCAAFDEWLLLTREHLHRRATDALYRLTVQCQEQANYENMGCYARRQLALNPWHEEAHRQLMVALARLGQRSAALAQYETCVHILDAELGVPPANETRVLYGRIRTGELNGRGVGESASPSYVLPVLQKHKFTHFFNVIDTDGDGFIEARDFSAYVSRLAEIRGFDSQAPEIQQVHADMMFWWEEIRAGAKLDGDGRIRLEEWLSYWSAWMATMVDEGGNLQPEALEALKRSITVTFNAVDEDGDGIIAVSEYGNWLKAWRIETDIAETFRRLDRNGDGVLTQAETLQLAKEYYLTNDPEAPGNYLYGVLF